MSDEGVREAAVSEQYAREVAACQDLGFVAPAGLVAAMDMEASLLLVFDFEGERSREDWTTLIVPISYPPVMGKKNLCRYPTRYVWVWTWATGVNNQRQV